ncbi:MAG: AAA family ATPase [Bacteroidales bacterium]|nr:AAA family ATPase [Bacteroidales bacterium]
MGTIKIHIHKFGPINDKVVEFAPFLIFTGNSNLGKSYVNYIFHYLMHSIVENMRGFLSGKGESERIEISLRDVAGWLDGNIQQYMRGFLGDGTLECDVHFDITIKSDPHSSKYVIESMQDKIVSDKEEAISDILAVKINGRPMFRSIVQKNTSIKDLRELVASFSLSRYIQEQLFGSYFDEVVILPPSRGALAGESFSVKDKVSSSMGMYERFNAVMDKMMRVSPDQKSDSDVFAMHIAKLIKGNLIVEKNEQYFVTRDGRKLSLRAAASSIKELSPLLLAVQNRVSDRISFCMEEPEAHLHPQMQIEVMDFIAYCRNRGMFFQITTHSDYFLQRFNQLIKLGSIREKSQDRYAELVNKIEVPSDLYMTTEGVKAYFFEKDVKGDVDIRELQVTDRGIEMMTFFDVVRDIQNAEEKINDYLG